jgi:hypothetical protein
VGEHVGGRSTRARAAGIAGRWLACAAALAAALSGALAAWAAGPAQARQAAHAAGVRAEDRRIERSFKARHRGYKVLGVFRSPLLVVGDWAAVYWLAPGAGGGYASGGATYYHNGRLGPSQAGEDRKYWGVLGAAPVYKLVVSASGNYSDNYSESGVSDSTTIPFSWVRTFPSLALQPDTEGYEGGTNVVTGTAQWTHTDSGDASQDVQCSYTLAAGTTQSGTPDGLSTVGYKGSTRSLTFSEDWVPIAVGSADASCGATSELLLPEDPAPIDEQGRGNLNGPVFFTMQLPAGHVWTPQSVPLDAISVQDGDESVTLSGSASFELVGLEPVK